LYVASPVRTRQSTPRGQLHTMIEIPGVAVKMYEGAIGEEVMSGTT
jgi:hypothetical protein